MFKQYLSSGQNLILCCSTDGEKKSFAISQSHFERNAAGDILISTKILIKSIIQFQVNNRMPRRSPYLQLSHISCLSFNSFVFRYLLYHLSASHRDYRGKSPPSLLYRRGGGGGRAPLFTSSRTATSKMAAADRSASDEAATCA